MKVVITLEEGYKNNKKTLTAIAKHGFLLNKVYAHFNIIEGELNVSNAWDLMQKSNKIMDIEGVLAVEKDDTPYSILEEDNEISLDNIISGNEEDVD